MEMAVAQLLGGAEVLGRPLETNLDLVRATRQGLPTLAAVRLAGEFLGSKTSAWFERARNMKFETVSDAFLDASTLTKMGAFGSVLDSLLLASANGKTLLTPTESDVVVRTARAMARATEVLGEKSKAAHWLSSPNRALGGEIPMSLLDTSAGEYEVETILGRIEYGVYS